MHIDDSDLQDEETITEDLTAESEIQILDETIQLDESTLVEEVKS